MKSFKKVLSLVLAVCILASVASIAAVTASANASDTQHRPLVTDIVNSDPNNQVETNTFYFYMPESWKNEYNDYYNYNNETGTFDGEGGNFAAGIYWWEGPYNCEDNKGDFENAWPGYAVTETLPEDSNIYVAKLPTADSGAGKFIWNNLVDGGQNKEDPVFYAALQTADIGNEYYDPNEDGYGFYPDGNEDTGFNNMIYVCNPKATEENVLTPGKFTYKGVWFHYYGNGEYGIEPTREEAEAGRGVYSKGEFPKYGLDIDRTEATIAGGETVEITPNDSTAKAAAADETIVSVSQDETGKATITGLKAGETKVTFTIDNNGEVETVEATITVTSDAPEQTEPVTVDPAAPTDAPVDPTDAPIVTPTDAPVVTPTDAPVVTPTDAPKPVVTEKKANPLKATAKTKTVKAKNAKKKKTTIKKAITVKGAQGAVSYAKVKKGSTSKIYKKVTVNKKTGAITLKKGKYAKKTYKVVVKVTAKGNANYKAGSKTVTVKIKVK